MVISISGSSLFRTSSSPTGAAYKLFSIDIF